MMEKRIRKPPALFGNVVNSDILASVVKRIEKNAKRKEKLKEMGEEKRQKVLKKEARKTERQAQRIALGFVSGTSKKNRDGPMIPWIPFTYNGKSIVLNKGISTKGHGNSSYTASWIAPDKKVPGVTVSRNNAASNSTGVPYAVYTGGAFIVNSTKGLNSPNTDLYITTRPLSLNGMNSPRKKLVKNTLAGPSVNGLTSLLYEINDKGQVKTKNGVNSSDKADLYSLKLLGDKFTAIETQRLNDPNNYIVKPYSASFAEYIQEFVWATDKNEQDKMSQNMIKERDNFLPFYFENGVVYTGDRPLFLFCVKKDIPCIIERGKNTFVFTGLISIKQKFLSFLNSTTPRYRIIRECLEEGTDKKISIFDCFHDFGKSDKRSFIGPQSLGQDLKTIYNVNSVGNTIYDFIELFKTSQDVKNAEDVITTFLDDLEDQGYKYNDTTLTSLFDGGTLADYCIMYDAGTAIPVSVYERIAATTQRVSNGFYGAPAIRKIANFKNIIKPQLERYNLPNLPFTNENFSIT